MRLRTVRDLLGLPKIAPLRAQAAPAESVCAAGGGTGGTPEISRCLSTGAQCYRAGRWKIPACRTECARAALLSSTVGGAA
jgi:hypothetical protein